MPNGWEAPDVVDVPAAGRARQQFQLKPVADPTYRQGGDVQYSDDEDVDDVESDKDDNGKRKRKRKATVAKKKQKTTAIVEPVVAEPVIAEPANIEKAAVPRPMKKKALDPTYRQDNDAQYSDDEGVDDVESDKDTNGKRKRKRKATAATPDPTYRQENDVRYSDEDEGDVESDKDTNGKRKRKGKATTAKKRQKTTVNVETAAVLQPVTKRAPKKAKSQAALLSIEIPQVQEEEVVTRRSTRKRQKTIKE